ncbi:hypothetical protein QQZ08_005503 [Neonectria magnoliae]|uniref:D-xylose 1-dehydrogenase (NADP(+), D-xylono-1,5-lactone-forming) n=1 Tax=Neonectria magnoliae TaxID=2732573 RepID=A0ABR1I5G4_9HYPO
MSLGSQLVLGKGIVVESAGTGRLENQSIDILADEFVQNGPEVKVRWVCNYFESSAEDHGVTFEQVAQHFAKHGTIQRAYQMPTSPGLKTQSKTPAAHYGGEDITIQAKWHFATASFISDTVVKAIAGSDGSRVEAVFSPNGERLEAFSDEHRITKRYNDMDELLSDPDVDVIYIGLPILATTMEDSITMIEVLKEASAFFLEGLMYLSHLVHVKVAEIISSGALGKVSGVSGYHAANICKKANPLDQGTIYNLGCYLVSLLHFVMETAYGKEAFASRQVCGLGNISTESSVHARDAALMARFGSGVLATIQSTDSFGNDFSFTIQGDKAVLKFKTNPWLPIAGDNNIQVRTYGGATEQIIVPAELDAFGYQVKVVEEGVASGIKEAARPSPNWTHSLEIMGLLTEWENDIKRRAAQD